MINRIKTNFLTIFKYFLSCWGALSALAGLWLSFFSWDDMGIDSKIQRILILAGIVCIGLLIATLTVLFRNQKRISGDINKGLSLCYNDIIKLGFPKKTVSKRIIVIPVNRCFDLSCKNNLISEKSIHGQWINNLIDTKQKAQELHLLIQNDLQKRNIPCELLSKKEKPEGNLKRYPAGTVVSIPGENNITYYLLALSSFDDKLRAHCSESEFYETIQGLLKHYDCNGQGIDMYCPVMGDHIVRPTRDTNDIIDLMLSIFKFNKSLIHGNIHLVVYNKMKNDISILDR